ncbi:hypothetical protein ACVXG7_30545 [Enterobacter hormaechei]
MNAATLKEPEEIALAMQVVVLRAQARAGLRGRSLPGSAGGAGRAA